MARAPLLIRTVPALICLIGYILTNSASGVESAGHTAPGFARSALSPGRSTAAQLMAPRMMPLTADTDERFFSAGIELHSIRLTLLMAREPFFRGELVPVTITLQNLGRTPLTYEHSCPPRSLVRLEGANSASPAIEVVGCGALDETILAPEKTVTVGQLAILSAAAGMSGLTAHLVTPTRPDLSRLTPSLRFFIGSHVPAGHQLTVVPLPDHRLIVLPQGVSHLLYYYSVFCDGGKFGSTRSGNGGWHSLLKDSILTWPSCNTDGHVWSAEVGAPPGSMATRTVWNVLISALVSQDADTGLRISAR